MNPSSGASRLLVSLAVGLGALAPVFGEATAPAGGDGIRYVAAGIAVGVACLGAGLAVGKIGAAAFGALAEKPELSGKAFTFLGLAEGICLWGFLVAVLILFL